MAGQLIDLNDTAPAAPSGSLNGRWQKGATSGTDPATGLPIYPASVNVPQMVGDTGSGGTMGLVPAPAAGDAAAGKVLKADGTWYTPPASLTNPMTAVGDLIIGGTVSGGAATPARLAAGASGYVLTSNGPGAAESWQTPVGGVNSLFGSGPPVGLLQASIQNGNSMSFPRAVTAGNLLIVACSYWSTAPTGMTDTLGTSYTLASSAGTLQVYYGLAPSSGANTITMTGGAGSIYSVVGVMEFINATATSDASTYAAVSSSPTTKSVTTTVANDLVVAFLSSANYNTQVFTFAAPYVLDNQLQGSYQNNLALGHALVKAAGVSSLTATITNPGSDNLFLLALETNSVVGSAGDLYFDTSTTPFTQYVFDSGIWNLVGANATGFRWTNIMAGG